MVKHPARFLRDLFTAASRLQVGTFTAAGKWRGTMCVSLVGRWDDDEGFHGPCVGLAINIGRHGYAVIWE